VWHGGNRDEDETLAQAYANSLHLASETGIKTIAFPAISTGVYGFPKTRAARIVFQTVGEFIRHHNLPHTIYMVFFSSEDENIFLDTIRTDNLE
jgi:O-acetyl-ADP-ribose deacetylase (regulator of RNase III)